MHEQNRKNIAIYGSCISKDPFTTAFNKNYKQKYNCIITDQKHSFISTMQEKEDYDEEKLKIYPNKSSTRYLSRCIKDDLEKSFIDLMLNNKIDYLILDINFEVQKGVIRYNGDKFLTNITRFNTTEYFSELNDVEYISIFEKPNLYFDIWKEYCNKFFNFLKINCPETKIVLAEVRALDIIQRTNGSCYIEDKFTNHTKISNIYYKQLENYIKKNFDVRVINFHKDFVINERHRWGKFYVHYDDSYYSNFLNKMDEIVKYDDLEKKVNILLNEKNNLKVEITNLKQQLNQLNNLMKK